MIRKRFEKDSKRNSKRNSKRSIGLFFVAGGIGGADWGKRGLGKGEGEREKLIFKKFWGKGKRDVDLERENVKGES